MTAKMVRILPIFVLLISLAGCNLPLLRDDGEQTVVPAVEAGAIPIAATEGPALSGISCLAGTWEVDSASLVEAGNLFVRSMGITIDSITPHLYFNFKVDGNSPVMEIRIADTQVATRMNIKNGEHNLEIGLNGSLFTGMTIGSSGGEFGYQNNPEAATLQISSLKVDKLPMPVGAFPLEDLIASLPASTMYYSCQSNNVIFLRDQNSSEAMTLTRVSGE